MTKPPKKSVFFESAIYRRNRLVDAARLLPLLGVFLFIVPAIVVVGAAPTASRWVFLFVVWVGLICAAAITSRALKRSEIDIEEKD